jgi:condensin complex subunit 3
LYEDVSAAVEENLLSDATSRNALYKIHVSLGKIVNQLTEQEKRSRRSISRSMSASVVGDEKTVITEDSVQTQEPIKEEDFSDDDALGNDAVRQQEEEDSVMGEALTDGE